VRGGVPAVGPVVFVGGVLLEPKKNLKSETQKEQKGREETDVGPR